MNPFEQMDLKQSMFTATDQQVHELLTQNLDTVLRCSATQIAEEFGLSQAAVTRYCKKLGYHGYADFRSAIYQYQKIGGLAESPANTIDYYCNLLQLVPAALEESDVEGFIEKLTTARCVLTTGYHKSSLPAQLLYFDLVKFGILSSYVAYDQFTGNEMAFSNEDVLVIFSAISRAYKPDLERIRENPQSRQPYIVLISATQKHPLRNRVDQMIWLPNYQNQNYQQYLETQISFMIFVDLLANTLASRLSSDPRLRAAGEE